MSDLLRDSTISKLPTRGEKRLVPVGRVNDELKNEHISNALVSLTDYVTIRIPSRQFTYRFLINPKSAQINRQTLDSQAMTRGGWQIGVWGEDTIDIQLQGTTAGQYFSTRIPPTAEGESPLDLEGLSDRFGEYSLSYRNLMELMNLFENNGYFYEGEAHEDMWAAPNYTRKKIKSHGDVELKIGNFIWSGMFANMTVTDMADTPFSLTFDLSFLAWKERFVKESPWRSNITNDRTGGHDARVLNHIDVKPRMDAIEQSAGSTTSMIQSYQDLSNLPKSNLGKILGFE